VNFKTGIAVVQDDELKLKLGGLVNNFAQLMHQNFVVILQVN
jgi:hypothetical protein